MAFLNQVVMSLDNSFKVNNATGRVKLEMVKGKSYRVLTSILHGRDFPAGFPDQSWSRSRRDSGPETGIGTKAPYLAIFWSFLSKN